VGFFVEKVFLKDFKINNRWPNNALCYLWQLSTFFVSIWPEKGWIFFKDPGLLSIDWFLLLVGCCWCCNIQLLQHHSNLSYLLHALLANNFSIKHLTIFSTYKQFNQWKLPATMDWGINTLVWFSTSQPNAIYCGLDGCFRLHEPKRQLLEIVMLVLNCVQENA
jgi:hypothetical protein